MTMLQLSQRLDVINNSVGYVVRWLTLLLMLVQFMVVLLRYTFGYTDIGVNESVLYMHSSLFMLAAGYTLLVDGHVRVDIFYSKASPRTKHRIDLFGHIFLLIPSITVLLIYSWPAVRNSWSIFEGPLSVGGIPAVFLLKSLIPAFCILLLIQSVSCILKILTALGKEGTAS